MDRDFIKKFWHTGPSEPGFLKAMELLDPTPAPLDNGLHVAKADLIKHQISRCLAIIEPYHRSANSATYGTDIESFLLPSKPAKVVQGKGFTGVSYERLNQAGFPPH